MGALDAEDGPELAKDRRDVWTWKHPTTATSAPKSALLLTAGGVVGGDGSRYLASLPSSVSFTDLGGTDSIPSQNGS